MIRVISKQFALALTVLSFSLALAHAEDDKPAADTTSAVIKPKPDDVGDDGAGKGLEKEKAEIESSKKALDSVVVIAKADETANFVPIGIENINKFTQQYLTDQPTCISRQQMAANACLEHLSPNILTGITSLNTIMSTLGGAAVKDQCSGFGNAMDIAKAAMTAYTAACGTMKASCGLSCVGARKGLEGLQAALAKTKKSTCVNIPGSTSCIGHLNEYAQAVKKLEASISPELNKDAAKLSVASKASVCTEKYAHLITSGLAGIASLLNSINQGKKCDEQSNGAPNQVAANDVCKDPAKAKTEECLCKNPQSPECICFKNPRTAGCAGGLPGVGENSAGGMITTGPTDKSNVAAVGGTPNLGPDGSGMQLGERSPNSADSGGAGAPTGGGATGLGGGSGGGSGSGVPGAEGSTKKGLDANILGGTGGGGGGSWGSSGGGGSEKYRAYLPGGAKDPGKAAGHQAWTKEVTGQGGKSNWEKVKERYRDNKNTLLNN